MQYINQWTLHFLLATSFLLCASSYIFSQEKCCSSVVALSNKVVHTESIEKCIVRPLPLKNVTFDADIYLQKEEFIYLTDLMPGVMVDAASVIKGVEYLHKKNKFSSIKISVLYSDESISLHYSLESFWTFKKVKIRGVFQERNVFAQCYVMSRGDQFSQSKHNHSILKIKKLLERDGYFGNKITTSFEYNEKTKDITVYISIDKGKQFTYHRIEVEIQGSDDGADYDELKKHIEKKLLHVLSDKKYKKAIMNREAIAVKTYLSHKGYLQTRVAVKEVINKITRTVDVLWKITVLQKRSIVFFGNRFFSTKELLEKIYAFGKSAWLMPATLLAEEILTAYKHKGFWNARVVGQEEKDRSFFVIQEGARAIIKAVEIRNVGAIDSFFLKKKCFRKVLHHKYYDFQLYNEAIKLLSNVYMNAGFLHAVVIDPTFVALEEDDEYKLVVTIEEGKQSYITSVEIAGYHELQAEGPFKKNFQQEPVLCDMKILDQQQAWLVQHFQQLGYLHPRVKPTITMQEHDISIVWTVDPGEKVYFGKTIVGGSSVFPFTSLMKIIRYAQGQQWDQEKIKQAFKGLKELNIFESITFTPDMTDKNQEKSIILKIHADDVYEVRFRAGVELQHVQKYQTFNGLTYKIGGTGLMRNPFEKGDVIRLDLDFAASHREVVACYKRPLFFKTPLMCNMQVYSIAYDQPGFVGSINDIYTLMQNGFSWGMESKTNFLEYSFRVGCEGMMTKIKDPLMQKSLIAAIDFQPQLVDQMVPFFYIEPTVMLEYLDNGLNPTSGFLTLCSLKGMIPFQKKYKDTLFVKLLCEQSFFIPLKTVVAACRIRFGHIFYRKLSAIMPSERFYLGGSHSLRGYEADLAPPLGVFVDEELQEHLVPRGGKSMLNINAELRVPIFKKLAGVVFQDFGILSGDTFVDFKPQNFLASTGFGTRFYTPLGPLRFDIGWRWRKQTPLERSFAWFLTFGQAF